MKIDPFDEAVYRRKLALNYLNRANNAFKNKDLPGCILFSQLTVENATKLAPEYGRAAYGEPEKRLTPEDIHVLKDAEKALEEAKKSIRVMEEFLNHWEIK